MDAIQRSRRLRMEIRRARIVDTLSEAGWSKYCVGEPLTVMSSPDGEWATVFHNGVVKFYQATPCAEGEMFPIPPTEIAGYLIDYYFNEEPL